MTFSKTQGSRRVFRRRLGGRGKENLRGNGRRNGRVRDNRPSFRRENRNNSPRN